MNIKKELEPFVAYGNTSIEHVIKLIQINESRCIVVVTSMFKVIGVCSEGDIIRAFLSGIEIHAPVEKILNPNFKFLKTIEQKAAFKLLQDGYTIIPIVNNNFILNDIITLKNIFSFFDKSLFTDFEEKL